MAWRPTDYLLEGELSNETPGKVTGWMLFAGIKNKVTFDLEGNFHRDIRGAKIRFTNEVTDDECARVAILAPEATVSIIKDYNLIEKKQVEVPKILIGKIKCNNPKCVTNIEPVKSRFNIESRKPFEMRCHYCERTMIRDEIVI